MDIIMNKFNPKHACKECSNAHGCTTRRDLLDCSTLPSELQGHQLCITYYTLDKFRYCPETLGQPKLAVVIISPHLKRKDYP